MPRTPKQAGKGNGSTANLGFEAKLWAAADALRNNMDAAEYKHVVLGLIFLKYISDAFEAKHAELDAQRKQGADPEDPDEYRAASIFWVPKEARWASSESKAPQPTIGQLVDDAMTRHRARQPVAQGRAAQGLRPARPRQAAARADHQSGQRYRLWDSRRPRQGHARPRLRVFPRHVSPAPRARRAASFIRPRIVVRVLVEMLAPYKGRVYDPCCGSGGMFVQSEKFIEAHGGKLGDISIYGQESNYTTWRLAKMNLAIRGIDAQIAHGDTFHNDLHPDLKADYVLANPPFNDSDWRGDLLKDDKRWAYGMPPPRATPISPGCNTSFPTSLLL